MYKNKVQVEPDKNKIILKTETKIIECKDIEGYEIGKALFFDDTAVTIYAIMPNGRPVNHVFLFRCKSELKHFENNLKIIMKTKESKSCMQM